MRHMQTVRVSGDRNLIVLFYSYTVTCSAYMYKDEDITKSIYMYTRSLSTSVYTLFSFKHTPTSKQTNTKTEKHINVDLVSQHWQV